MFPIRLEDFRPELGVTILEWREGGVRSQRKVGFQEAHLLFLEQMTFPMPKMMMLPALSAGSPSAMYFGSRDTDTGVWFVGVDVHSLLREVNTFMVLSWPLEAPDPHTVGTPFARLLGRLYNERRELLSPKEIRRAEQRYEGQFSQFVGFYVWMMTLFSSMPDRPFIHLWLTLDRAALWASLDTDKLRTKFLEETGRRIQTRRTYPAPEFERRLYETE